MRRTGPVTQVEYPIAEGQTLVSTTDLKSRIVYCNPSFVEVSGYTREELLGQPHNLVRHPDMPQEAFRDLWATIQSGQPWSGLVKNRRKNGDHYWVLANVTPILHDGHVSGYMSVRTKPTREQVAQAEALYACMREEAGQGRRVHALAGGEVQRRTLGGQASRVLQWLKAQSTGIVIVVTAAAGVAVGESPLSSWVALTLAVPLGIAAAAGLRALNAVPLHRLKEATHRMAAGELRRRDDAAARGLVGQIQRGLSQLNVNLQAVVSDVRTQVDGIHDASREIAAGSADLSQRTEQQAGNLQQTVASLEQITATIQANADASERARTLAAEAQAVAEQGARAVTAASDRMRDIEAAARRIGEIVGVIDGISFQTNLLALNAAVEAARAGEQGRGFAVVAGEVRNLAARARASAHEIKGLIADSEAQVKAGTALVAETQRTVQDTTTAIARVSTLVAEISHASGEQAQGVAHLNTAVSQLDSLTQQNAAMCEQLSASAAALNAQAGTVTESVRIFRV